MSSSRVVVVLGIVLLITLLIGAVWRATLSSNHYAISTYVDFAQAADHWSVRMQKVGTTHAYLEMAEEAQKLPTAIAHSLAHSFGEALFRTEGMRGFGVCDEQFVYGCYHQFTGAAIAAHGIPVLEELRAICSLKSESETFPCLHGVGHGILGFVGYEPKKLKQALSLCLESDTSNPTGCASGVFMEYNMRSLTSYAEGTIVPRAFSTSTAYSPCFDVDSGNMPSCIRELPNWWVAAMRGYESMESRIVQAGTFCTGFEDLKHREGCFKGIGHIVPPMSDMDAAESAERCRASGQTSSDRTYCLFGAVRRFRIEGYAEYASLCSQFGFSGSTHDRCLVFAQS